MAIFSGTESLGISSEEMGNTLEPSVFLVGTSFVRQMLIDTRPTICRIGPDQAVLSHGTDVWLNNAQNLMRNETAKLAEVISVSR